MATRVQDVPAALGEHMLMGWVLTDQSCPTRGCTVPLLRSPARKNEPSKLLCVNCDKTVDINPGTPLSVASTNSYISRTSTPPTEVSLRPDSPPLVPAFDPEQLRRRREQSDRASAEIGKRLLQGWAMLGAECPNEDCYGVPLVRPPKAVGEKDPRKECVICGNVYTAASGRSGKEILTVTNPPPSAQATIPSSIPFQPHNPENALSPRGSLHSLRTVLPTSGVLQPHPEESARTAINQADQSTFALQTALQSLSARLVVLSTSPTVDPISIAQHADAIGKVAAALTQVRLLQRNE